MKSANRHFRDATQGKEAVLVEETTPALLPCVLKYRRGCLQQTHLEQVTGSQVQQEAESRMICLTSLTLQHIFAGSAPSVTTAGTFPESTSRLDRWKYTVAPKEQKHESKSLNAGKSRSQWATWDIADWMKVLSIFWTAAVLLLVLSGGVKDISRQSTVRTAAKWEKRCWVQTFAEARGCKVR